MEDRFHKLRAIYSLGKKKSHNINMAIIQIQSFYHLYKHDILEIMTDNEETFRSLGPTLAARDIKLTLLPSGQHNQIIERSNRTLQEKVSILKSNLTYELPDYLEPYCFYYAVYLLNRTWNSNTGRSTPWELQTGIKLNLRENPLVKFGTIAIFFQPLSLRTAKHPYNTEIGIFVGKSYDSPKSFEVYIPARGTTVHRGTNYKMIPDPISSWNFKPNPRFMAKEKKKIITSSNIILEQNDGDISDDEDYISSFDEDIININDEPNIYDDISTHSGESGSNINDNMYWDDPDPDTNFNPSSTLSTIAKEQVEDIYIKNNYNYMNKSSISFNPHLTEEPAVSSQLLSDCNKSPDTVQIQDLNGLQDVIPLTLPENNESLKDQSIQDELQLLPRSNYCPQKNPYH
jgi:hypothetical protein